jgi:hypothetical protein
VVVAQSDNLLPQPPVPAAEIAAAEPAPQADFSSSLALTDPALVAEAGDDNASANPSGKTGVFSRPEGPGHNAVRATNVQPSQRYHWNTLMWQSLAFNAVEDTYRLITDDYMRYLIADGPYWHNYSESMKQWNMRRWNDGDSFLVDYIGHPMEGAVAGYIEIQNSPRQKYLRISGSREYWRSKFYAMMWATVFSTQQKIGPMGEAALGNAGGYTYALHCPYPCKNYQPGVTKYTNNTGWTDFITTPTIGTLWTVLEDFLDRRVSDPLEERYPGRLAPRIFRGAVNPTRTMANALRGKNPWYRDWKHNPEAGPARPPLPREESIARGETPGNEWFKYRFELFPHLNVISLPVNTETCSHCRKTLYGPGMGFAAGLNRFVDFDADVVAHSDASPLPSDRAGGSIVMGNFGFRSGLVWQRFAVRAAIRPGFLSYDKALQWSPKPHQPAPSVGRITHFMTALALSGDVRFSPHFGARFVLANDPVRYREAGERPQGVGKEPHFNWLSHQIFLTNENWSYQTGMTVRF